MGANTTSSPTHHIVHLQQKTIDCFVLFIIELCNLSVILLFQLGYQCFLSKSRFGAFPRFSSSC